MASWVKRHEGCCWTSVRYVSPQNSCQAKRRCGQYRSFEDGTIALSGEGLKELFILRAFSSNLSTKSSGYTVLSSNIAHPLFSQHHDVQDVSYRVFASYFYHCGAGVYFILCSRETGGEQSVAAKRHQTWQAIYLSVINRLDSKQSRQKPWLLHERCRPWISQLC
jgi:hypothetical protein